MSNVKKHDSVETHYVLRIGEKVIAERRKIRVYTKAENDKIMAKKHAKLKFRDMTNEEK